MPQKCGIMVFLTRGVVMADEDFTPTPQQDDLFYLVVSNFLNKAASHHRVLADSRFSVTSIDMDKWVEKKDLPKISERTDIMDFIWNHYCNCKCG